MAVPYKKDGKIVTITLNRPERLNRIDAGICQALSSALIGFKDDPEA
jgi:enoyl-CoA hydratase/carnithine racemase